MAEEQDIFKPFERLGFIFSESLKKKMCHGVNELLWSEISKSIVPTSEVQLARKNILLHKLSVGAEDNGIESIKKLPLVKEKNRSMKQKINVLEKKFDEQHNAICQKAKKLRQIKEEKKLLEVKKKILSLKLSEMEVDIEESKKANEFADKFLPPSILIVDESRIEKSVALICDIGKGISKKEALQEVSDLLGPIQIPLLWQTFSDIRAQNNQILMEKLKEDFTNSQTNVRQQNDTSKLYLLRIKIECEKRMHQSHLKRHQQIVSNHICALDEMAENQLPEFCDWVNLQLQVKKNTSIQTSLRQSIAHLEDYLEGNSSCEMELRASKNEVERLDTEIENCKQDVQKSLRCLKNVGWVINEVRRKLSNRLDSIEALKTVLDNTYWLDWDLHKELLTFQEHMDMNCFRKIILKEKRENTCFVSKCMESSRNSTSSNGLTMIRAPIHHILEAFKAFHVKFTLEEKNSSETVVTMNLSRMQSQDSGQSEVTSFYRIFEQMQRFQNSDIFIDDALHRILMKNEKIGKHMENTRQVLDSWRSQNVQNVVLDVFEDTEVSRATLKEWLHNFALMIHVIERHQ